MGCVHIYCGDGKGKTTAAIGLAVRAAGRGKRVLIARFLKTNDSGEVLALNQISNIRIISCEKEFGFTWQMTTAQKLEAAEYYAKLLEHSFELSNDHIDLLILDEVVAACNHQFIDEQVLKKLLNGRPEQLEVVMTGRNPSAVLQDTADYLSEIQMKKHPFLNGLSAREGIEY